MEWRCKEVDCAFRATVMDIRVSIILTVLVSPRPLRSLRLCVGCSPLWWNSAEVDHDVADDGVVFYGVLQHVLDLSGHLHPPVRHFFVPHEVGVYPAADAPPLPC